MHEYHIAMGISLLVLVASAGLLGFAAKTEVCCKNLIKGVAYVALLLGTLNFLCISYNTVKYWGDGCAKNSDQKSCQIQCCQEKQCCEKNQCCQQTECCKKDQCCQHTKGCQMMNGQGCMMKNKDGENSKQEMKSNTPDKNHEEHHPDQGKQQ